MLLTGSKKGSSGECSTAEAVMIMSADKMKLAKKNLTLTSLYKRSSQIKEGILEKNVKK